VLLSATEILLLLDVDFTIIPLGEPPAYSTFNLLPLSVVVPIKTFPVDGIVS